MVDRSGFSPSRQTLWAGARTARSRTIANFQVFVTGRVPRGGVGEGAAAVPPFPFYRPELREAPGCRIFSGVSLAGSGSAVSARLGQRASDRGDFRALDLAPAQDGGDRVMQLVRARVRVLLRPGGILIVDPAPVA